MKSEHDSLSSQGGLVDWETEQDAPASRESRVNTGPNVAKVPGESDAELLTRFLREKSDEAFTRLVHRYRTLVIGTAIRRRASFETAQEVAQEVFATLARKASSLLERESLAGWLHRAATFQTIRAQESEHRRLRRELRYAQVTQDDGPCPTLGGANGVLDEALADLDPGDHEILVLHYFQELPYPELAAALKVNEAAARQRVSRALHRLEKHLKARGVKGGAVSALLAAVAAQKSAVTASAVLAGALVAGNGWTASSLIAGAAALVPTAIKLAAAVAATATISAAIFVSSSPSDPASELAYAFGLSPAEPAEPVVHELALRNRVRRDRGTVPPQVSMSPAASAPAALARVAAVPPGAQPAAAPALVNPMTSAGTMGPATGAGRSKRPPEKGIGTNRGPIAGTGSFGAPGTNLAINPKLPGALAEIEREGGLPAVLDELQAAELNPARATELYQEMLAEALNLQPVERAALGDVLTEHFENLNDLGLAGLPPIVQPVQDWVEQRAPVIEELGEKLVEALATLPDTGLAPVVNETIPEVIGLTDQLLAATTPAIVDGVAEAATGMLEPVVSPVAGMVGDVVVSPVAGAAVAPVAEATESVGLQAPVGGAVDTVSETVNLAPQPVKKVTDVLTRPLLR